MSKLHQIEMFLFAAGLVVLGAGCSSGEGEGGGTISFWQIGQVCVPGSAPADPAWCSGPTWACAPAGQCLPTRSCSTDQDCGCSARGTCDATCVESRCYRTCAVVPGRASDCSGTSRCEPRTNVEGVEVSVCI